MFIKELEINNARSIRNVRLKGLPKSGIIIISGDNETGKSTMMECIHALFEFKSRSNHRMIKSLQPIGEDVPTSVHMVFNIKGIELDILKQWNKSTKTVLKLSGKESGHFTGDEAENKLSDIVDQYIDPQLRDSLFVAQGTLENSVAAAKIDSLQSALAYMSNNTFEDLSSRPVFLDLVQKEYEKYFSSKRKKKVGLYKKCEDELEDAAQEFSRLKTKERTYEEVTGRYEKYHRELEEETARRPEVIEKQKDLLQKVKKAEEAEQKIALAKKDETHANEHVQSLTVQLKTREDLKEKIAGRVVFLEELKKTVNELELSLRKKEQIEQDLLKDRKAKSAEALDCRTRINDLHAVQSLSAKQAQLEELSSRIESVQALNGQLASVDAQYPEVNIDDYALKNVENAATELEIQRRLKEETSAKLCILDSGDVPISVNGEEIDLKTDGRIELVDGTELEIGTFKAVYRAYQDQSVPTFDKEQEAHQELVALLEKYHCATLAELRNKARLCASLDREKEKIFNERNAQLRGNTLEELHKERVRIQKIVDSTSITDGVAGGEDVESCIEDEMSKLQSLEESIGLIEEDIKGLDISSLRERWISKDTKYKAHEEELVSMKKEYEEKEAQQPYEELLEQLESARDTANYLSHKRREMEDELNSAEMALVRQDYDNVVASSKAIDESIANAKLKMVELRSEIRSAEGVAEEKDKAEAHYLQLRDRYDSIDRKAKAAELLWSVLQEKKEEFQRNYSAPLKNTMDQMAARVFGLHTELVVASDLSVEHRAVNSERVSIDLLSGGAREQIALIFRLGIAELVRQSGEDIPPIFLDDALGSSDPTRLGRVANLLESVGQQSQLFILTCYPRRYETIQSSYRLEMEELKAVE